MSLLKFDLGDYVVEKKTGFQGTVMGCAHKDGSPWRYSVQGKKAPHDVKWIDEDKLELVNADADAGY